ncbi:hypothetical protein CMUS01_05322 [Colletotrichum musicola]|uniref:Uncharacterized protein n=1 Tax=Colletotrichum musicola TaxID=2175873 RepID=A0A8H6KS56_9PEZI|nr:hypothetical protein CMUS01_05322 [Colletotrichum musicola]
MLFTCCTEAARRAGEECSDEKWCQRFPGKLARPRQLPKGWGPSARRDLQTNLGLIRHHPWRPTPTTPRTDGPSRHLAAAAAYSVPFPNALGYGPQTNKGALITVAIAKGTKPHWRSCSFDSLADADSGVFDKKWRLRPLEATPSAGLQIATRLGRLRFTAGNTLREQRDGLAPSRIRTGPTTLAIFRGPKVSYGPFALWSLANSFTKNGTTLPNGEGSRDGTEGAEYMCHTAMPDEWCSRRRRSAACGTRPYFLADDPPLALLRNEGRPHVMRQTDDGWPVLGVLWASYGMIHPSVEGGSLVLRDCEVAMIRCG